jgi:predicted esterase
MLNGWITAAVAALSLATCALGVPPDRADLGEAYLRYELAVEVARPTGDARATANRAFDALTGAFFAGDFASALTALADATAEVRGLDEARRDGWRYLAARRAQGWPRAVVVGSACAWKISWEPLDGVGLRRPGDGGATPVRWTETRPVRIVVRGTAGELVATTQDDGSLEFAAPAAPETLQVLAELAGGGELVEIGRVAVLSEALPAVRARMLSQVDALAAQPDTADVAEALRARVELLSDAPERTRSASLLADLPRLVAQLDEEFAAAGRGDNPFAVLDDHDGVRRGRHWRVHRLLGANIPVARYVPSGEGPFPVVVAFHGAGGDECMFFEGYGRGELQRLAERERFIAICPATVPFAASPNLLDALVAELAAELPIDRDRVYLLGHSLGAVTAGRLAALKPKSMRGAALIAGFSDVARKSTPATRRLWAAELDPIFSAESLAKQHSDAVAAGRPFELTRVPNEGHTLVVGAVLPEAVSWLLRLPAPAE